MRWVSWTAPVSSVRSFVEEDRWLDQQGVVAVPLLVQMLEGQMLVFRRLGDHVDRHLLEARLLPRVFGVVDSFGDAVALPDPVTVHGEGGAQDGFEPLGGGRAVLVFDERRAPLAARDVGRGVEERRRIHPHREAGLDEQLRGGQPHHSRAEHRDLPQRGPGVLADQIADLDGAAPAHRDARATVSVVVDDEFRSDPGYLKILRLKPKGALPVRTNPGNELAVRQACSRSSDRARTGRLDLPPGTPCDPWAGHYAGRHRFGGTSN